MPLRRTRGSFQRLGSIGIEKVSNVCKEAERSKGIGLE